VNCEGEYTCEQCACILEKEDCYEDGECYYYQQYDIVNDEYNSEYANADDYNDEDEYATEEEYMQQEKCLQKMGRCNNIRNQCYRCS
jgi:hypothetical protein